MQCVYVIAVCHFTTMNYKKLNTDWNADPNDPQVELEIEGSNLKVEFCLNTFLFAYKDNATKGELIFEMFEI